MARAAQYVRMSTESQKYSIPYQAAVNAAYALEHGHDLVATYADAGISGLTLARRQGLQALLGHIVGGAPDFRVVLVHDVSRWGRFQDPDESAQEQLTREMRAKMGKQRFGKGTLHEFFATVDEIEQRLVKQPPDAQARAATHR